MKGTVCALGTTCATHHLLPGAVLVGPASPANEHILPGACHSTPLVSVMHLPAVAAAAPPPQTRRIRCVQVWRDALLRQTFKCKGPAWAATMGVKGFATMHVHGTCLQSCRTRQACVLNARSRFVQEPLASVTHQCLAMYCTLSTVTPPITSSSLSLSMRSMNSTFFCLCCGSGCC
jgi:hypothetical protein